MMMRLLLNDIRDRGRRDQISTAIRVAHRPERTGALMKADA